MKKLIVTASILCLIMIATINGMSQANVDYGSNNGKYLTVKGVKLYYEEYGQGTPLFLLHGGLSSIKGMASLIPKLSEHFKVIVIDAPGQGRSEQLNVLSFQGMAATYSKMIDVLKFDSIYLYGFSVGAITAMHLAADRPDKVKRAVFHSGVSDLDGYNELFYNSHEMTVQDIERDGQWWLTEHLKRSPQGDQWKKFINDLRGMWIPHEFITDVKLASIKCSTLITQGDKDMIKLEIAVEMKKLIPASQLCVLPNTTHFVLSENPELLLDILVPFFQDKKNRAFELTY